jgi:eukaryotic-like serine/threonine-protein kinase
MALTEGSWLGHYEILGPLGVGGMGQVYRARDARLDREVAIKVLRDDYVRDPDWLARFEREARLLAALNHANIATVHGLDEADGVRYLVMELVPGTTLAQRLAHGPLPLDEALGVCRQIAEALEAAHDKGIIHRDLKPANVKLTPDGKVKVLDFGLAKNTRPAPGPADRTVSQEDPTREGAIIGTPAYMAPEQARGKPLDRRCDVWAFGCVLYEVLSGKKAFAGATFSDTLAAVIERTPAWEALPAGLPPRVGELVRRCLQKDPQRRLRDAGDARLEIEEALAEPAHGPPAPRPPRRRWWPVLAAAVVLAAFALGMVAQALRDGRPHARPRPRGPANWSGQFLLGGTTRAFGPRVSPDGQWLAFSVLHDGQAQVGVMKLGSGEWWVLTRDRSRGGLVSGVCWSADSTRLYFDRFFDVPVGVFSVSPLDIKPQGASERRVLDRAECPQVAADGSLVVCKLDDAGNYRLHRHWPNGDRPGQEVSPPVEFSMGWPSPVRALRAKNQVVFCGKLLDGKGPAPKRRIYLLDLDTKAYRPLPVEDVATYFVPLAVSPDDRFVYTILPAGDLFRVVRLPVEGDGPPQTLLTLVSPSYGLDVDGDGRLYFDQFQRPLEVLRFAAAGGPVERVASPSRGWGETAAGGQPVELPDGRVLLPSKVSGRDQLLAGFAGKDPVPLLGEEDRTETAPPAVLVGARRLAFVAGSGKDRHLKLADWEDDQWRVVRTLKGVPAEGLMGLAASPDGRTLYYVRSRQVWEVPADGSRPPQAVEAGDGVAVFPGTGDLLVQRIEKTGVRLFQVSRPGGPPKEVRVEPGPLRLAPSWIGARAIAPDGRVLVTATSQDSWFWRVALLDPATGRLEHIPVDFAGDVYRASWGRDGKVLGMGYAYKSELWRLAPQE